MSHRTCELDDDQQHRRTTTTMLLLLLLVARAAVSAAVSAAAAAAERTARQAMDNGVYFLAQERSKAFTVLYGTVSRHSFYARGRVGICSPS
eukprot:COSAG05_NODE_3029_length_2405_cov_18.605831_2_plen_92_part_00